MNGIVLINKPAGITSFGVVAQLRRLLKIKRIGHTGTLDPNATGVLVVLLGQATKLTPFLAKQDKCYLAKLKLGIKTNTGDIWGETIKEEAFTIPEETRIKEVLQSFIGTQLQLPPLVSAIKKDGKKLYEYARDNIEVEREPREITIHELELRDYHNLEFLACVSSGTYIRTLCEDIGEKLGIPSTMEALRRISVGEFKIDDCYSLSDIESGNFQVISPYEALVEFPYIEYEAIEDVKNGKNIKLDCQDDLVFITNKQVLVAAYKRKINNVFECVRGLW